MAKRTDPVGVSIREQLHTVSIEVDAGGAGNLRAGTTVRVVLRFVDRNGDPREAAPRLEITRHNQSRAVAPQEEELGVYSYALTLGPGPCRLRASSIGTSPTTAERLIYVHDT